MARIWLGPIERALVVEHPALELDTHLEARGINVHRMKHIPNETELIEMVNQHQIQVIFKRSKVDPRPKSI